MTILISQGKKLHYTYYFIRDVSSARFVEYGGFRNAKYLDKNGQWNRDSQNRLTQYKTFREAMSIFKKYYKDTDYYVEKKIQKQSVAL